MQTSNAILREWLVMRVDEDLNGDDLWGGVTAEAVVDHVLGLLDRWENEVENPPDAVVPESVYEHLGLPDAWPAFDISSSPWVRAPSLGDEAPLFVTD